MTVVKVIPAPLKLTADWKGSIKFSLKLTEKGSGNPVDASLAQEIWFTAKQSIGDADNAAIVSVTKTGGGITITGTDKNIVNIKADLIGSTLPNAAASLICDCKYKGPDGYIQVLGKGSLSIVQVVTQSIV